jgi:hypothetical protein
VLYQDLLFRLDGLDAPDEAVELKVAAADRDDDHVRPITLPT